ncbi:MAG: DoxX family protein [Proteobacteria bacterium]|nr:DoxX family protein [Pseudomonadota bacterium]
MSALPQSSRVLFAVAMIALGITGLVNGDFALVWQHVPAQVPGRTVLAYVCAVLEVAFGIGLLFKRTLALTGRVVFPYMVLWLVLLQMPGVIRAPLDAGSWGSFGEIAIITAGAWCLFATRNDAGVGNRSNVEAGVRTARWLLIIALPMIGVEVIVDALQAGDKIMQPWLQVLPDPMAWACLTGIGSIATCLALLFGVWPRLAATLEAAMLGLIAIAYWAPDLYTGRTATTAFIISFLIAAAVWVVADTYHRVRWFATGQPVWKT